VDELKPNEILPWQGVQWDRILRGFRQGQLAHALLLAGPAGTGKTQFAVAVAHALACRQPTMDGFACGQCRACSRLNAGAHPDYRFVTIEPDSRTGRMRTRIVIDQVRELARWLSLTPSEAPRKMAVISPADKLNPQAANALLKTLEEPPGESLLILASGLPGRLPATIRSRCQRLEFPLPARAESLEWLRHRDPETPWPALLELGRDAPLLACRLAKDGGAVDPVEAVAELLALAGGQVSVAKAAQNWAGNAPGGRLAWWRAWLEDLARLAQGGAESLRFTSLGENRELQKLAAGIDWEQLHRFIGSVSEAWGRVDQANPQLLMEGLFVDWIELTNTGTRQAMQ
jgi:DNA polymerase-3 subunit delta'